MYRRVILSDGAAWSVSAGVLASPSDRFVGISRRSEVAVLLLTRSIHTFTLREAIAVAVLDLDGLVLTTIRVAPRRVVNFSERRWVIELRGNGRLPSPGTRIGATTMPELCPEH